ncbi:MAG: ankyrin repeat domain-containing protein [Candidatus Kariarchaeaceae archaeon]|jgi:ankyrin repeat protein
MKVEQRWVRPEIYQVQPGHWKKQLSVKYLTLARKGELTGLQDLLSKHPDWLNKRGSHNRTFLWEAARAGKEEVVSWLLDQGAELDAYGSYNNESYVQLSPYVASIYYKRPEVSRILEIKNPEMDLFRATFLGQIDMVQQLLDSDPTAIHQEDPHDNIYHTPLLSFAVMSKQPDMVSFLLARNHVTTPYSRQLMFLIGLTNQRMIYHILEENGMEPHYADGTFFVTIKDLDIMRLAIEDGADINVRTKSMTPLMYMSRGDKGGNLDKVKLLLESGPSLNSTDRNGRSALHYACRGGNPDLVGILLEAGINRDIVDSNGKLAEDLVERNRESVLSKF